jgi:hypothetical protein
MPPRSGTENIKGAVLRLQRPDSSIVIAQCVAKGEVFLTMVLSAATQDVNSPLIYRDCRIPDANSTVEAEFHRNSVKLFMRAPSVDGTGKVSSETYSIRGVLQPLRSFVRDGLTSRTVFTVSEPSSSPLSSTSGTVALQQLKAKLRPLIDQYQGIVSQGNSVIERCKGDLANGSCLALMKKLGMAELTVCNSSIPLLGEKIDLLNALPQDEWVRAEEDETVPMLDQMKGELQAAPAILSELDSRLAALAQKNLSYQSQTALKPVSQLSAAVLQMPSFSRSGLSLKRVNQELEELDSTGRDLSDQWVAFQKDCPDPTTDEICLEDKRQVALAIYKNTESRIQLIDQKILLLDAEPQDAAAQQAEDESAKRRGDLAAALRRSQEVEASFDKSLAELKRAREDR